MVQMDTEESIRWSIRILLSRLLQLMDKNLSWGDLDNAEGGEDVRSSDWESRFDEMESSLWCQNIQLYQLFINLSPTMIVQTTGADIDRSSYERLWFRK